MKPHGDGLLDALLADGRTGDEAGADQADKQGNDRLAEELKPGQVELEDLQNSAGSDEEQ